MQDIIQTIRLESHEDRYLVPFLHYVSIRTIRCFQEGGGFTSLEWDGTTIKIGDCLLLQAGSGSLLFKTRNISKSSITAADVDDEYPEKYRKKECGPPLILILLATIIPRRNPSASLSIRVDTTS